MAYVQSSGRLYIWGSGSNGQLGSKDSGVTAVPVRVKGPFIPHKSSVAMGTRSSSSSLGDGEEDVLGPQFVIHRIAAGGDQTFLFTTTPEVWRLYYCVG